MYPCTVTMSADPRLLGTLSLIERQLDRLNRNLEIIGKALAAAVELGRTNDEE